MTIKLILDTDPGIDDAMAIFYAIGHPDIDLVGFTSIFGNVRADEAALNALRLLEFAGVTADVAQGATQPLEMPANTPSYHVHGDDGMGNANLPAPVGRPISQRAAEYIVEKLNAHPGEITLAAVGPVTNLALALQLDPSIVHKVKQVIVMGGAARAPGNVTPVKVNEKTWVALLKSQRTAVEVVDNFEQRRGSPWIACEIQANGRKSQRCHDVFVFDLGERGFGTP